MRPTNLLKVFAITIVLVLTASAGTYFAAPRQASVLDAVEGAGDCPYEDKTSGVGGQSGDCHFVCKGPGTADLSVSAQDEDASVSGSGTCAGEPLLHCAGRQSCSDSDITDAGGPGHCSGSSSEWFDSGIYISCSSRLRPSGEPPDIPRKCPVQIEPSPPYPHICIDPLWIGYGDGTSIYGGPGTSSSSAEPRIPLDPCRIAFGDSSASLCLAPISEKKRQNLTVALGRYAASTFQTENGTISAHIWTHEGATASLLCWDFGCLQRLPACGISKEGTRVTCSVR